MEGGREWAGKLAFSLLIFSSSSIMRSWSDSLSMDAVGGPYDGPEWTGRDTIITGQATMAIDEWGFAGIDDHDCSDAARLVGSAFAAALASLVVNVGADFSVS